MSSQGQSGEKTEQPTQKKLEDSRKQGIVAKSQDLTGSITILGLTLVMPFAAATFGQGMITAFQSSLANAPTNVELFSVNQAVLHNMQPGLMALLFIVGTAMVLGLFMGFGQVGVKLTPEAMKPKAEMINPVAGFKRLFSKRSAFEAVKTLFKAVLFTYIAYAAVVESWPRLMTLTWGRPAELASVCGSIMMTIGTRVGGAWLVIAILDYAFQKQQTNEQLKMTKDEVKREYKEQEGSPEVKMARMQRARKLSRGRMAEAVKSADVIITNPTHYAVAIKYKRDEMHAPVVVAKGVDYLALKIRQIADENRVPIVPNPPLARSLYKHCEVGDFIPRDMFSAVAEVLAYVYRTIQKVK